MKQLTAADFKKGDLKKVEITELDGFVFIRKLSVKESLIFSEPDEPQAEDNKKSDIQKTQKMIFLSVTDESGQRVFQSESDVLDSKLDQIKSLTQQILDYNGLSQNSHDAIKKTDQEPEATFSA